MPKKLLETELIADIRDVPKGGYADFTNLFSFEQLIKPREFNVDIPAGTPYIIKLGTAGESKGFAGIRVRKGDMKPLARGFLLAEHYTRSFPIAHSIKKGSKVELTIVQAT